MLGAEYQVYSMPNTCAAGLLGRHCCHDCWGIRDASVAAVASVWLVPWGAGRFPSLPLPEPAALGHGWKGLLCQILSAVGAQRIEQWVWAQRGCGHSPKWAQSPALTSCLAFWHLKITLARIPLAGPLGATRQGSWVIEGRAVTTVRGPWSRGVECWHFNNPPPQHLEVVKANWGYCAVTLYRLTAARSFEMTMVFSDSDLMEIRERKAHGMSDIKPG